MSTESPTAVLPIDELIEFLGSARRPSLVIGGKVMPGQESILLYRGDLKPIRIPLTWFVSRRNGPRPDPTRLAVTDYGQTVRLGDYEAAADGILLEFEEGYSTRDLDLILADRAETQSREEELLAQISALLDAPAPEVPQHILTVFARAKKIFGREAALFLTTPHRLLDGVMPISVAHDIEGAQRVQDLLGRVSSGVCV